MAKTAEKGLADFAQTEEFIRGEGAKDLEWETYLIPEGFVMGFDIQGLEDVSFRIPVTTSMSTDELQFAESEDAIIARVWNGGMDVADLFYVSGSMLYSEVLR